MIRPNAPLQLTKSYRVFRNSFIALFVQRVISKYYYQDTQESTTPSQCPLTDILCWDIYHFHLCETRYIKCIRKYIHNSLHIPLAVCHQVDIISIYQISSYKISQCSCTFSKTGHIKHISQCSLPDANT